ncbi:MAG: GAF domain-containing sensor histidine kinase [Deltaproteobacteria bacterium]|nr:GAF domain-containing sensor histidine kinase [Deltaproteobacteria bacterium]
MMPKASIKVSAKHARRPLKRRPKAATTTNRVKQLEGQLHAVSAIGASLASTVGLDALFAQIVPDVSRLMRAARTTLFLYDPFSKEIWSKVAQGDDVKEIRLKLGQGIAGWVAEHLQTLNIRDAYSDQRFNREVDRRTGFRTRSVAAAPLVDRRGQLLGVLQVLNHRGGPFSDEDIGLLNTIAVQTAYAVENAHLAEKILNTERLAIIGRMLAGVAHDLRNPMSVISGYAETLASATDAKEREGRCGRIQYLVEEMTGMISDLLAFARGESQLRLTEIDIEAFAREVAETLRMHCEPRGIGLTIDAKGGTVLVDSGRVKRILYNLAKNAVDVMSRGDHLTINLAEEAGGLSLRVTDTGPGIPDDIRSHIFEPFVTSGKANGTGLGLSIVKRFVDDHGGRITVESAPGRGTSFFVYLPRMAGDQRAPARKQAD